MSRGAGASPSGGGVLRTLGHRLTRHGGTYGLGSVVGLSFALVQFAVLTRILPIADFGRLAILVFFAGLVALLCRIGAVQGTLVSVFRGADDDIDDEEDEAEPRGDPRRVLGTGLVLALALTAALTAAAAAGAGALEPLLIDASQPGAVTWAALAGGLEGVWRLVSSIPRFERRPAAYVGLNAVHAALRLTGAVLLVELGGGLEGAIAGLALGSAAALVPGLLVSRHRFRPALDREHVRLLLRRGSPFVLIAIGFWGFRNGDVYLVSRFLPDSDVALYRAAGRIALPVSAATSALLLAWGPLVRGPLRGALHRERSLHAAGGRLVTYYWLISLGLLVAVAMASDLLIRIAPSDYADATPLIPLLGIGLAAQAGLMVVYRTARIKNKRAILQVLALSLVGVFLAFSLALIPPLGLYGAAAALFAAPAIGAALLLFLSQRGPNPLPLPWRRLGIALVAAGACVVGGYLGGDAVPALEPLIRALAIVAFPALLVATGAVPRREVRALLGFGRSLLPSLGRRPERAILDEVPPEDLELVELLAAGRRSPAEVAAKLGRDESFVLERLVAVLRRIAALGPPASVDARIGRYLLATGSVNERDRLGHRLALEKGVEPLEVEALADTFEQLRAAPAEAWEEARRRAEDELATVP